MHYLIFSSHLLPYSLFAVYSTWLDEMTERKDVNWEEQESQYRPLKNSILATHCTWLGIMGLDLLRFVGKVWAEPFKCKPIGPKQGSYYVQKESIIKSKAALKFWEISVTTLWFSRDQRRSFWNWYMLFKWCVPACMQTEMDHAADVHPKIS